MENVEFPISWSNNKEEEPELVPALADHLGESPVQGQEEPQPLAFEDQNFDPVNFIILSRIYDLLAVIAMKIDPLEADRIISAHEAGKIVADPPYLSFDEDE